MYVEDKKIVGLYKKRISTERHTVLPDWDVMIVRMNLIIKSMGKAWKRDGEKAKSSFDE